MSGGNGRISDLSTYSRKSKCIVRKINTKKKDSNWINKKEYQSLFSLKAKCSGSAWSLLSAVKDSFPELRNCSYVDIFNNWGDIDKTLDKITTSDVKISNGDFPIDFKSLLFINPSNLFVQVNVMDFVRTSKILQVNRFVVRGFTFGPDGLRQASYVFNSNSLRVRGPGPSGDNNFPVIGWCYFYSTVTKKQSDVYLSWMALNSSIT